MTEPLTKKEITVASGNYPHFTDENLLDERKELINSTRTGRIVGFLTIVIGVLCFAIGNYIQGLNGKETDLSAGLMWVIPFAVPGGIAVIAFAREPRQSHIEHELNRRSVDYTSKTNS